MTDQGQDPEVRPPASNQPCAEAPALANAYRKVTARLLPLLFACYVISYLDRVNVGFAKLQMDAALGFGDAVYGLGAGIFFVGYFLFEVPSNLILHRVGARRWIARILLTWGMLSAATAFVTTPMQFYTLRFFLGVAEAGFFPGVLLYLTYWFPAARCASATATFMTAVPLTGVIGGPLSGWILEKAHGTAGLSGWQWLFMLEALPAVIASFAVWGLLYDSPDRAPWLSQAQKQLVRQALAEDARLTRTATVRAAFRTRPLWRLAAIYFFLVVGLYGVGFWLPTLIRVTGVRDALQIGLLCAIPYGVGAAGMLPFSRHSDRNQERRLHLFAAVMTAGLGLWLSRYVGSSTGLSIVAMTLATTGIVTALPVFWALPTSRLCGRAAAGGRGRGQPPASCSTRRSTPLAGMSPPRTESAEEDSAICRRTLAGS